MIVNRNSRKYLILAVIMSLILLFATEPEDTSTDSIVSRGEDGTNYYGHLGQDKWILTEVFPGLEDGYFVEVGAWHPTKSSNSKALEDKGWQGLCIEPFPQEWKGRSCKLVKEVVFSEKGKILEFRLAGSGGGLDEKLTTHKEYAQQFRVEKVVTTTLADILERYRAPAFIHYMSIDIEGAELDALKGFPFEKYTVGAFTIEINDEEAKGNLIRQLLESNGYRFARKSGWDDYYLHNSIAIGEALSQENQG